MNWFQELAVLTDCISRIGGSRHVFRELITLLKRNCKTQEDFQQMISSPSLPLLLSYNDDYRDVLFQEFGFRVGYILITLCAALPKKDKVGLRFLMKVSCFLGITHPLYIKCRRDFVKLNPKLLKGDEGSHEFFQFVKEIVDEVHDALDAFGKEDFNWPDISSLLVYVDYLERSSNEVRDDVWFQNRYEDLLAVMIKILDRSKVKDERCLSMLIVITRLGKLIGKECGIQQIVRDRALEMMHLSVVVMGTNDENYSKVKMWLQELNLVSKLFNFLIDKVDSLFANLNNDKLSKSTLATYGHFLRTAEKISKEVDSGETKLKNLLMDRKEEASSMYKMLSIYDNNYCPDESLSCLENLMCMADPELCKALCLSILPKIRQEGMEFEIKILRRNILKESMEIVLNATRTQLVGPLIVKFKGEEGRGLGVTKEWLFLAVQELIFIKSFQQY